MDEEKYQKELFDEFEKPNKPLSKLSGILPKPDLEGRIAITLTLEKIIFISIAAIMIMIVVFALGVESGRRRALSRGPADARRPSTASKRQAVQSRGGAVIRPAAAMVPATQGMPQKGFLNTSAIATLKPASQSSATKPYTILAATFSKKETAQSAAAFLKKEGLDAFITYGEPYYRVCVGSYPDMQGPQVQKDLVKVKRIYKDAFVRQR